MALFYILVNLVLLVNVRSIFCAESNGQKAHFQVEDKSGDLKITATKDLAKVTAQADSVQVVVNPGTADYPVLKSDKPVVHVSGPMCCNGGWNTFSSRKKSAVPSTRQSEISWRNRQEKTPESQKAHASSRGTDNLESPREFLLAESRPQKMRLNFKASGLKAKESGHHKIVGKVSRKGFHYLKSLTRNSLKGKNQRPGELTLSGQLSKSKNAVSRKVETSMKSKLARLSLPFISKSLKQAALHRSKVLELPGTKKTEVKGTGPSFHVTGNAGKLKMHVTKDETELTSESGGVDVLLKPSASGSSGKTDAQARSKQVVHLATELGGNFEGLGVKKSILSHSGQNKG